MITMVGVVFLSRIFDYDCDYDYGIQWQQEPVSVFLVSRQQKLFLGSLFEEQGTEFTLEVHSSRFMVVPVVLYTCLVLKMGVFGSCKIAFLSWRFSANPKPLH